jgi:hypothetical protein
MALLWAGWTAMGSAAVEIFQLSFPHRSLQKKETEKINFLLDVATANKKKRQKKSIFCLMSPLLKVFFGHGENSVDYSLGGFGNETFRISLRCTGRGQAFCFWAG